MKKILNIIPGLTICVIISILSKLLGEYLPSLGASGIAIILGIIIGNSICTNKRYFEGAKFSEKDLLSFSIVLMGGTLSLNSLKVVGISGVLFIVIQMTATMLVAVYTGKILGFSKDFRLLMASGNAVCGSSAIAATAPIINASEDNKGIAITIVNLTGTVLMFALPLIANTFYHGNVYKSSKLIGGTLQSVGQVMASGSFMGSEIAEMATIFKIIRIIFLVVVVIIFEKIANSSKDNAGSEIQTYSTKKKKFKIAVPWYITGFFLTSIAFSIGIINPNISHVLKSISSIFEIIALAAIGMRVNIKTLIKQGPKASLLGAIIGLSQILIALTLISIF